MIDFFPLKGIGSPKGKAIKRLWDTLTSHLAMFCSVLIAIVGLVGVWFSFWPGIITFALSIGSLILHYRAEKRQKEEMALINIRLQTSEIVAQEVFDKPYYGGPLVKLYPSAPATRTPMKPSAPPVKREGVTHE